MRIYSHATIVHIDGDAFFASCEQAINPKYKGKPIITGAERGIVAAASYEAKAFGVKRGVHLRDAKKMCPKLIILPSNYETYSIFSQRMFQIIRRFTPTVEEYSIDEAFADITGLRGPLNMTYQQIGLKIQKTIESELGITVSVGIAGTKVLAKIASNWQKPSGLTLISTETVPEYLNKTPVEAIWGIGKNTSKYLHKCGIKTALEFARKSIDWIDFRFSRPYMEIWRELNNKSIYHVNPDKKKKPLSISKTKTFNPASSDPEFLFSKLTKNIENAFIKLRRYSMTTKQITIFIKKHDPNGFFKTYAMKATLNRETAYTHEVMPIARKIFQKLFNKNNIYRATGIILSQLKNDSNLQISLFEKPLIVNNFQNLYQSIDELAKKYGKHTVFLGSSLKGRLKDQHHFKKRKQINLPEIH